MVCFLDVCLFPLLCPILWNGYFFWLKTNSENSISCSHSQKTFALRLRTSFSEIVQCCLTFILTVSFYFIVAFIKLFDFRIIWKKYCVNRRNKRVFRFANQRFGKWSIFFNKYRTLLEKKQFRDNFCVWIIQLFRLKYEFSIK